MARGTARLALCLASLLLIGWASAGLSKNLISLFLNDPTTLISENEIPQDIFCLIFNCILDH
jgi:hypothetical protein